MSLKKETQKRTYRIYSSVSVPFMSLLSDKELSKLFKFLELDDKRRCRQVSRRFQSILDNEHLKWHRVLSESTIPALISWPPSTIQKLTACDLLKVNPETLSRIHCWDSVEHLELESPRPNDYLDSRSKFEQPTIGEKNLIQVLRLASRTERLVLHSGSLGNFGLELIDQDENDNEVPARWQWPTTTKGEEEGGKLSSKNGFLHDILGNMDHAFGYEDWGQGQGVGNDSDSKATLLDPHTTQVFCPFPAFEKLKSVQINHLLRLEVIVKPTQGSEKMGLIAFLHVLKFPLLRSFTVHCQEYVPDEALYRSIFLFIAKHKSRLKQLTFSNPVLSTHLAPASPPPLSSTSSSSNPLLELGKVRLKEITIAWEVPLGLDLYWSSGQYLLEQQRRLRRLEFHTTSTQRAGTVIMNNYKCLTHVILDITDTEDWEFDCACFEHCGRLKTVMLHVAISVKMKNVSKLPSTIETLHWDAMYTRDDIAWFSRFLILARAIYLYHDKDVPMDIFRPFDYFDFLNFIQLPRLEQLHLPRVHVQDKRVTEFCSSSEHSQGIRQERDLFFIDRRTFSWNKQLHLNIPATSCTPPN